jgi:hypothetical protein
MKIVSEFLTERHQFIDSAEHRTIKNTAGFLKQTAQCLEEKFSSIDQQLTELQQKLATCYNDLNKVEYRLHAVFSHREEANYGHYWICIYDWENERWLKYNDETVTVVGEKEVFRETTGKDENPYCLVYVDAKEIDWLVRTVKQEAAPPRKCKLI